MLVERCSQTGLHACTIVTDKLGCRSQLGNNLTGQPVNLQTETTQTFQQRVALDMNGVSELIHACRLGLHIGSHTRDGVHVAVDCLHRLTHLLGA